MLQNYDFLTWGGQRDITRNNVFYTTIMAGFIFLAAALMLYSGTSFGQSPVAHWSFNYDFGSVAVDQSGNGNDGHLVNNPVHVAGYLGMGVELDGKKQHIAVDASASLGNLKQFTYAAWIYPKLTGNRYIISQNKQNFSLFLGGVKLYLKGCVKAGPLVCSQSLNGSIETNKWQFVAMTYDDNGDRKVHLYIDGHEVAYYKQPVASGEMISSVSPPLTIGIMSISKVQPFAGIFDEVKVFDTALDSGQILDLHQRDVSSVDGTVAPIVTVVTPVYETVQTDLPFIDLAGTAVDDSEVVKVLWNSDRGGWGDATGTTSWAIAAVPLQPNENLITVTAYDLAGNVGGALVNVVYLASETAEFEGFGATATGGAGQPVYHAGSATELSSILQSVNNKGGNASIKLGGSWSYSSNIQLSNLSNVTLDGSGSSVTFNNMSLYIKCSENIIVQGLHIRNNQSGDDAIQVNSSRRVVIDHNSVSAGGDGNIDVTGWSCGPSSDVTVSWNILADTWKQSLVKYGDTSRVSFHHNLFYNSGNRLPALHSAGVFDVRNNVFWQWGSSGTALNLGAQANIVGNFYAVGNTGRGHVAIWYVDSESKAWIEDNVLPAEENDVSRLSQPLAIPATTTHDPQTARQLVLDKAGAWPRDAYDAALVYIVRDGKYPPLPPYHD